MRGAIPPLLNTPSWRGTQLKHTDNFTLKIHYRDQDVDESIILHRL
jgi:hypothetical protein